MNIPYSEYVVSTGRFTGNWRHVASEDMVGAPREGHAWLRGEYHPDTHRVVKGAAEAERAPAPSPDHEWNETAQRWELSAAAERRESTERRARGRAGQVEADTLRAMREVILQLADHTGLPRSTALDVLQTANSEVGNVLEAAGIRKRE